MRIGYSFWGFLGPGITDTPDGGRSHRATLIDGLTTAGYDIVFLQPNRDLDEARCDLAGRYRWDQGLPDIDALFLEWRWPIMGRNTIPCGTPGHTCDLHRQKELLAHYTLGNRTRTLLWDKDQRLPAASPLRSLAQVTVCEPALAPSPGAVSLLFPVADDALDSADPAALAAMPRPLAAGLRRQPVRPRRGVRRVLRPGRRPSPAPRRGQVDPHRPMAARHLHRPARVPRREAAV
jgi:hypothetical protein